MFLIRLSFVPCALLIASLAGCNQGAKSFEAPTAITYAHSGCYGSCPAYTIEVERSGKGTFEGRAYTAVRGKRVFSVTARQFDAFVKALAPARPRAKPLDPKKNPIEQSNVDFQCPPNAPQHTDDTGVFLIWWGKQNVYFDAYYGCDAEHNKTLYDALDDAPKALGLKDMIGPPQSIFK